MAAIIRLALRSHPTLVSGIRRSGFRAFSSLPTSHNPNVAEQDKLLFTPGPLTTSFSTKQAALHDLGSRDGHFVGIVKDLRSKILDIAGVSADEYTTILMQGSGTFGVESVISSVVSKQRKVLIVANGAYGLRMSKMTTVHGIPFQLMSFPEDVHPCAAEIKKALDADTEGLISHVAIVHSETTSGIINPVEDIGKVVKAAGRSYIVDAMSSFGAVPVDLKAGGVDYLVTSANKCLEGIPGFSVIVANKTDLKATEGTADTLSLDIHSQVAGLDGNGQFQWTPPTHAILAFRQAITEYEEEGGLDGRLDRYMANKAIVCDGFSKLGFDLYLSSEKQGPIISSFRYPSDPNWSFEDFYSKINDRGIAIYPGKVSNADCFRIGHVGRLFPSDSQRLVEVADEVCQEMKTAKYYSA